MLKRVYCLLTAEPELISGFADFVKELDENCIEIIHLRYEGILLNTKKDTDAVLITDRELRADMPIAGFLNAQNRYSLSYKYLFESFEGLTYSYVNMVYCRFYGLPLEILETGRLIVREMTLDDIERLYEIYAEPSITKYLEGLYPDKSDELEFAKSYIENMYGFYGYGLWLVIEKSSGIIIGRAGLGNREVDGEACLELGYIIAKEHQRKGYATEVSLAILDYAKSELCASHIISLIKPDNEASICTAKKLGFYEECEVMLGEDDRYLKFCRKL